jgi:hypothetical protein
MSDDLSDNFCTIQARFSGGNSRGPYIRDIYNLSVDFQKKTGQIEYNGYCYLTAAEFPIERGLLVFESPDYYSIGTVLHRLCVRITGKEEFEDTSECWDDPEEGMMCLFPTNRIRLTFELIPTPRPPPSESKPENDIPISLDTVPTANSSRVRTIGEEIPIIDLE